MAGIWSKGENNWCYGAGGFNIDMVVKAGFTVYQACLNWTSFELKILEWSRAAESYALVKILSLNSGMVDETSVPGKNHWPANWQTFLGYIISCTFLVYQSFFRTYLFFVLNKQIHWIRVPCQKVLFCICTYVQRINEQTNQVNDMFISYQCSCFTTRFIK